MRNPFATVPAEQPVPEPVLRSETDKEAGMPQADAVAGNDNLSDSEDSISKDAQLGVQKVEATTKVWTKQHLIMAYVFIWIIYFVDAMEQGLGGFLTPYVTSTFSQHSLTAATGVISGIIGGVSKLVLAKILDIWGRPQGFVVCISLLTLGLIMMAACQNVETYAAAQVFYWVGYNGVSYSLSIFIADTSHLKNRALMLAFVSSPYLFTVWFTSPLAASVLATVGWRWGFGIFAIVTPLMATPLALLFQLNYRKAKREGVMPAHESGRTLGQSIKHYFWEFDVICLLLLCGGFSLFLLPFNIYSYQYYGWRDPLTLSMLVVGFVLLVAAVVWEQRFAPVKFMPWDLLKDRTVLGACVLAAVLFIEFYLWNGYFFSFNQAALNIDIISAGYIANVYSIGSCLISFVAGILIRWSGRFKWVCLYLGVPLTILGVGLMIHFRTPGTTVGYVVLPQILIAAGGGFCVICEQMAVMAAASHQHVAVVLAVEGMFASVGGAIGGSIATAIWTSLFPAKLAEYLPQEAQANLTTIYGSLPAQLSYEWGSPERDAIVRAYGEAQKWMLVAATTILIVAIPAVMVWRDIKVKDFKQVKGTVI
ncbi:siderophore iron transporter mirB [Microdochium trichocladiopsis]|uniref:Siderophore iron transporter mirB n=1 Tax=Microdochium trichocladiopsis TaxID=1682393 RepID=A0A9P8YHN8_9PEZI|nr:siderophore iron transporter mirB [Microdochium trichocladiopsis]KAH7040192.1 siderophore iron transporter mirB [Microdochium trichocladiopsis]